MKKILNIGILLLTISTLSQNSDNIKIGYEFPEFDLKSLEGNQMTLNSLKGEIVFINLWFTACAPCIEEMPALNKLREEYKDRMKFISITFNDKTEVENFLLKKDFNFQHLVSAGNFLKESLKNENYPKNIILDKYGCIVFVNYGLPYTKDSETGEMTQLPYTYFRNPINKIIGD